MTQLESADLDAITKRLNRVHGQVGGILRMVEDGRECEDIVLQIAAATKALERVGFEIIAARLQKCVRVPGNDPAVETARLQRLFLSLA